jgi:hypothetical protein
MSQVQGLKEQLIKLETTTQHQSEKKWKKDDERTEYQRLEREIEYLKSELNKSRVHDRSEDIVKHMEKNDRQKDYLSDHNQVISICF